ncbi:MAG: SAM-dependent methyltransferase [Deltaproteobacteria bacterium]|nr:SAM-dependent methyltransferase [Deltaproteobacteria bacterium]
MTSNTWDPGRIMQTAGNYWHACTLHAGVKLDVFTLIGKDALAADIVAKKAGADTRGMEVLLNALSAMELLEKEDGRFSNTPASQQFLSQASEAYMGHIILHHHHMVDSWSHLDKVVVSGKPVRKRVFFSDEETRKSFLLGMLNIAMQTAPLVVPKLDLSGRRHLLDLGGGPGTYAIHFCRQNPDLKATIFDLPTTRPIAQQTVDRFKMADRIQFAEGDYTKEPLPVGCDVAWLSHILHGEGPKSCRTILEKTASALAPGGVIIIHDFILRNTMDAPLFPALFSLNMLAGTREGRAYSEEQIKSMLLTVGAKNVRRIPVSTPNDSGIIIGELTRN